MTVSLCNYLQKYIYYNIVSYKGTRIYTFGILRLIIVAGRYLFEPIPLTRTDNILSLAQRSCNNRSSRVTAFGKTVTKSATVTAIVSIIRATLIYRHHISSLQPTWTQHVHPVGKRSTRPSHYRHFNISAHYIYRKYIYNSIAPNHRLNESECSSPRVFAVPMNIIV